MPPILFEADVRAELEEFAEKDPLGVASCMYRIVLGPRRGQRVERVGASEQIRIREDAKVAVELKSRWRDGTTHLVFSPLELVEKAAALIPCPHTNLLVYHGALAANAKGRGARRLAVSANGVHARVR